MTNAPWFGKEKHAAHSFDILHMQTLEDDDDYYLWDEGGRPCVPAPGARLDQEVQDVLCVPEWQEEGIPTKSKQGRVQDQQGFGPAVGFKSLPGQPWTVPTHLVHVLCPEAVGADATCASTYLLTCCVGWPAVNVHRLPQLVLTTVALISRL